MESTLLATILWVLFIFKAPDAGNNGGQEEKGATEDEMVGWHHGLQWT